MLPTKFVLRSPSPMSSSSSGFPGTNKTKQNPTKTSVKPNAVYQQAKPHPCRLLLLRASSHHISGVLALGLMGLQIGRKSRSRSLQGGEQSLWEAQSRGPAEHCTDLCSTSSQSKENCTVKGCVLLCRKALGLAQDG